MFQSDRREPEAPGGPQEVPRNLQKALGGPKKPPGGPKGSQKLQEAPRNSLRLPEGSLKAPLGGGLLTKSMLVSVAYVRQKAQSLAP